MSASVRTRQHPSARIVIIGTGFGGLCMAIRLKQAGIHSFVMLEKADAVGGTWRDNDYPGAACDVPSHLYSFSFERNPRWSRAFAAQHEIRAYLERCVDTYGLAAHLRFNTEVVAARFDDATAHWDVTLADGEVLTADVVVTATGGLSRPAYPALPGLERFRGACFHSARWDHGYALDGKRVGVIGTGASAIQFVPRIAPRVDQLTLFQRTPPWILPKRDRAIGRAEQWLYARLPFLQTLQRLLIYWTLELRVLGLAVHPRLMAAPERQALRYLTRQVRDTRLRGQLTPHYAMGCKRILLSNDYYQALQRPNLELVDVGIEEVTGDGVRLRDGRHVALDALILGTGFQAAEAVAPFEIRGRNDLSLEAHWREGAEAYVGCTVAGFPNLFMLYGPNVGLGHSSMVFMLEAQVEHVMRSILAMQQRRADWVEVREDVQRRFNERLQAGLAKSVWAAGCTSWYKTSTGKITTNWPSFTFAFRHATRRRHGEAYRFGRASE